MSRLTKMALRAPADSRRPQGGSHGTPGTIWLGPTAPARVGTTHERQKCRSRSLATTGSSSRGQNGTDARLASTGHAVAGWGKVCMERPPTSHHGVVLEARNLSVEVGGRLTLEEASFTVRAGDKVGLVGRNGAGKTSLLKVLGGEMPAAGGDRPVHGRLGFLTQDPRRLATEVEATGLAHVLSGRGLDEAAERLEKLRLAMEEDPSERAIHRYSPGRGALRGRRRLRSGGRGAPARRRARAGRRSPRPARRRAVGRGAPPARAGPHPLRGSDVLLLDEPTNHLDSDAKAWLMGFLRGPTGAPFSWSATTSSSSTRRSPGSCTSTRACWSSTRAPTPSTGRPGPRTRCAWPSWPSASPPRSSACRTLADSMRHQTAKRARVAKSLDKRVARLQAVAMTGPGRARAALPGQLSRRRPTPAGWSSKRTAWPRPTAGRRCSRR